MARSTGTNKLCIAAESGDLDKARKLLETGKYYVNETAIYAQGYWVIRDLPLLCACRGGHLDMVRMLISEFKADMNIVGDNKNTPLHEAARYGKEDVALALINEFGCYTNIRGGGGGTVLHSACAGGCVALVRTLIHDHNADVNAQGNSKDTPLHEAAANGKEDVALALINEFGCDTNIRGWDGRTMLHSACAGGCVALVRTLIHDHNADVNVQDDRNDRPLHVAAEYGKDVALALINEFGCDTNIRGWDGKTVLHSACAGGCVALVRTLIHDHNADVNAQDNSKDTPLHTAAKYGKEDFALALINEFGCDTNIRGWDGRTMLHSACAGLGGCVALVRTLIHDHNADVNAQDNSKDTPLHMAAANGKEDVALALINEFGCETNIRGRDGRTMLHSACAGGCVALVRTLIHDHNADVNAQDNSNYTPLHVAAEYGKEDVVLALIDEFGCDTNARDRSGKTFLHATCFWGNANIVKSAGTRISPFVQDNNGNTPLHLASRSGSREYVEALLQLNAPIMLRNASGKTSRDIATGEIKLLLDTYIKENKSKIYVHYDTLQEHAKKKYSTAEPITRLFVIGNPGAGKSSFVETMKREGFLESFWRVSESSVPLHTAGIVPSIYVSKHYGRVLFYDFAGDPEYYSSHAAILENIASSRKGDNIFIIVVNLREDIPTIRNSLHYWFSFVQHQKFCGNNNIIIIGSHSDLVVKEKIEEREKVFQYFFKNNYGPDHKNEYFKLDCCKPKSKELKMIQDRIVGQTQNSPRYKLSLDANLLLGLLEKDFGNVTACSAQTILDHIEITGILLPKNITSLLPVLQELHEIGVLFMTRDDKCDNLQVILNISKLTNEVHKLLFSNEAKHELTKDIENADTISSFNIGVLPKAFLDKILPEYITKECLVQLQYCQEISHKDVSAFPSLPQSVSSDQSFLFFPALCCANKSDVAWTTPPGLSYGIGWLAQCADTSCDHFPSRFLHVLLLRLIFKFTLQVPTQHQTPSASSPDHSHLTRRCAMWNSGVHWDMEDGVECMVELVDDKKGIAVVTKSKEDILENCISVFNRIVSCVMKTKAEFCYSIRPQFFLLNPTTSVDYLHKDNLFALCDVMRVLNEGKAVVLSVTGNMRFDCSKIAFLRNFTLWNNLFPLDFASVLSYLQDVVRNLYMLGISLRLPHGKLDAIEADFPTDTEKRRIQLVRLWMSSSPDPPCWWLLAQALEQIDRALAHQIKQQHSKYQIQHYKSICMTFLLRCTRSTAEDSAESRAARPEARPAVSGATCW